MHKLLPVVVASLMLAILSEKNSAAEMGEMGEKKYIKKDVLFYTIMALVLTIFVGLRTSYNDTGGDMRGYAGLQVESGSGLFKNVNWKLGAYPGFRVMNIALKAMGVSTQNYIMILAFLTVGVYLWSIRKYSDNVLFSVFLFIASGCYTFTMAGLKQAIAVAFCTIGIDRAIKKKWVSFVLWVLLGSTFHPYSLIFLITPMLTSTTWSRNTYLILGVCVIASIGFQTLLEGIEDVTTAVGKTYSVEKLSGDGVNIFRALVAWVPVLLSFFAKENLGTKASRKENILMNLTMLHAALMLIALFGSPNYFGRLANYFLLYPAMALPSLFKYYNKNTKQILTVCAVVGYSIYFYYNNCISRPFDIDYEGLNFFDYLGI